MLVLCISERYLLNAFLRRRRMSICIYLFTAEIPVNYTSEFWELSETATYIHSMGSLRIILSYANDKRGSKYGRWNSITHTPLSAVPIQTEHSKVTFAHSDLLHPTWFSYTLDYHHPPRGNGQSV
jgi:hypothetical protein